VLCVVIFLSFYLFCDVNFVDLDHVCSGGQCVCVDWRDYIKIRDEHIPVVSSISRPPVKTDRNRDKFPGVNPTDEDQLCASYTNIIRVSIFIRARAPFTYVLSYHCS
jgi:hypothetical protein